MVRPASGALSRVQLCAVLGLAGACSVYSSDLAADPSASPTTQGSAGSARAAPNPTLKEPGGAGAGAPGSASTGGTTNAAGSASEPGAALALGGDAGDGAATGGAGVGAGGGGGSGALGGSGTAPSGAGAAGGPVSPAGDLLDGFEDEDLTLEQSSGRGGVWYLFDDGTPGSVGPVPLACSALVGAPPELGRYAMHVTATGFTDFGSGLGVDFRDGKKVYDASKLTGIRFWARVGEGKNTHHRLQLTDATTDPAGGKCSVLPSAPAALKCDDHFGINKNFTTSWAQYSIRFDELGQLGWGNSAPALDKAALYGLQFTAKAKLEVDLWLDQIEFF